MYACEQDMHLKKNPYIEDINERQRIYIRSAQ